MSIREYMTFDDLQGLNSNPDAVREKFASVYGLTPDGICMNKEGYYAAVSPTITEQYGHYCYKQLGKYEFMRESSTSHVDDAIIGSNTAVNHGDTKATIQLTVNGSWSESTGYSSSVTTGMKFSTEFTIEGVFKMGAEFSMSVTAGSSHSNSESKSSSATVTVEVPPKSKVKVDMVAMLKKENLNFKVPIDVSGMFGANFSDRVNGHYSGSWMLNKLYQKQVEK